MEVTDEGEKVHKRKEDMSTEKLSAYFMNTFFIIVHVLPFIYSFIYFNFIINSNLV